MVPVVGRAAPCTGPLLIFRGLGPSLGPHAEQYLPCRIPAVDLTRVRPYRPALYSSIPTNCRPPGVVDRLGESGLSKGHHAGLHAHRLVLADQPCGELMVEVTAGVGHPRVEAGDLRRAFSRFFDPFRLRDRFRWERRSVLSARATCGGVDLPTVRQRAKAVRPRSMPMLWPVSQASGRSACGSVGVDDEGGEVPPGPRPL